MQDTSTTTPKKRIEFVDIAKGIAMLAIVWGHAKGPGTWYLYEFHVPIFLIIAGYFLSARDPFGLFAKKKAARLLGPYLFTATFIFVATAVVSLVTDAFPWYTYLVGMVYGAGSFDAMLPAQNCVIGVIWFLQALFIALLEVRALTKVPKAAPFIVVALTIAAVASSYVIWLPFNIQSGLCCGLFVYVGWLFKQAKLFEQSFGMWHMLLFGALTVIAFELGIYVNLCVADLGTMCLGVIAAPIASVFVLMISKYLERVKPVSCCLTWVGKNSMTIMCIHSCIFGTFSAFDMADVLAAAGLGSVAWLIMFVVQVIAFIPLVYIVNHVPALRKVFVG